MRLPHARSGSCSSVASPCAHGVRIRGMRERGLRRCAPQHPRSFTARRRRACRSPLPARLNPPARRSRGKEEYAIQRSAPQHRSDPDDPPDAGSPMAPKKPGSESQDLDPPAKPPRSGTPAEEKPERKLRRRAERRPWVSLRRLSRPAAKSVRWRRQASVVRVGAYVGPSGRITRADVSARPDSLASTLGLHRSVAPWRSRCAIQSIDAPLPGGAPTLELRGRACSVTGTRPPAPAPHIAGATY